MQPCCLLPSVPIRALTLDSAESFVQTRTSKNREILPRSAQDTGPLAERAIGEIVVARRLHAVAKKLLYGTWNSQHKTLHCSARLAGS
jgi:hypothetical protein